VQVPREQAQGLKERIAAFLGRQQVVVSRKGKEQDIRPRIVSIEEKGGPEGAVLEITLEDAESLKPRVQDVVQQLFGTSDEETLLVRITRTAVYCRDRDRWITPMEVE
jgi:hypothetical protein